MDAPSSCPFPSQPYTPHAEQDPNSGVRFIFTNISASDHYSHLSCEEMRWCAYTHSTYKPMLPAQSSLRPGEVFANPTYEEEIGSLLDDPLFADTTFVVEGEEIKAHRNILCARSSTFRAMFTSGLTESAPDAVIKLDCPKHEFKKMLKFIYSAKVEIEDVNEAIELISMANEYFLPQLKSYCESLLSAKFMDETTVVSIWQVANIYNAPSLKEKAMEYIIRHMPKVDLSELTNEDLAELLVLAVSSAPVSSPAQSTTTVHPHPLPSPPSATPLWGFSTPSTTLPASFA